MVWLWGAMPALHQEETAYVQKRQSVYGLSLRWQTSICVKNNNDTRRGFLTTLPLLNNGKDGGCLGTCVGGLRIALTICALVSATAGRGGGGWWTLVGGGSHSSTTSIWRHLFLAWESVVSTFGWAASCTCIKKWWWRMWTGNMFCKDPKPLETTNVLWNVEWNSYYFDYILSKYIYEVQKTRKK